MDIEHLQYMSLILMPACAVVPHHTVLIRYTEVVIFDEATSNLDQLTEKKIYDNLRSTNKTQIIITHRLSSIRDTDYIYVLNRGSIIEQGTHLDLMKKKGWYFESIQ